MSANLHELSDLCTPWCIHVVATLRIAERIEAGVERIDALAAAAKCDPQVLHGVLSNLVGKGVFEEPQPGLFKLNEAARGLLDPAMLVGLDLDGIGGRMAGCWSTLLSYVRTGASAYHEVFGMPFWQDLDAHPAVAESFDALIGAVGHGAPSADFQITGGWDGVRTVVDVGGGTGGMLAAMLVAHPHLNGTLVELPRAVARAAETFQSAGVADRATGAGQSFFDPLPAGADLYLLRGVVNNWPDHDAIKLLSRCADAARPADGRVVVLKSVGPNQQPRRISVDTVLTGGKQRSIDEFRGLCEASGLEVVVAAQQATYYVVELRLPKEPRP